MKFARISALVVSAGLVLVQMGLPVGAQLSSPIGGAAIPPGGIPLGSGPGVHGANSPFAPLKERADVLAWSVLSAVKTKNEKNRLLPVFPTDVQALNKKTQRIQGFMMPLGAG
ncbi:MAG: hypothetical protein U5M53_01795, partial [Rhodoferax sp.]|nr:hypothetical protein [Rhodoferax sp.]